MSTLRQRPLRQSLNSWISYAANASEARRVMVFAASAFSPTKVAMRKALNRWSDVWVQRSSLRRAVSALTSSSLRAGFNTWAFRADAEMHKLALMRKVAASLSQGALRASLNTWKAYVIGHEEARRQLLSAVSAFSSDGLRKAWNSWSERVSEQLVLMRALNVLRSRTSLAPAATIARRRR